MREKDEDKCTEENKHQRKQSKLSEKYSKNTPINILTDIWEDIISIKQKNKTKQK